MTETLQLVEKLAVLAFLVSNMLATGLNLTPQAVLAPLSDARLVLIALALNFVLAPAFAWLLTRVFPLDRGHAIVCLIVSFSAAGWLRRGIASAPT